MENGLTEIALSHSLKWAHSDWRIRKVIDEDFMIANYLQKDYAQISFAQFERTMTKTMNETTTFEPLLALLRVVAQRSDSDSVDVAHAQCEQLTYNQYAWRELGGPPIVCAKGVYLVWNI